jgi:hypothetical protein
MRRALLLAAVALALGGCGSSSSSTSSSTSASTPASTASTSSTAASSSTTASSSAASTGATTSKARYIIAADAICRSVNTAAAPETTQATAALKKTPPQLQQASAELLKAAPIGARGLASLRALPRPVEQALLLARFLRAAQVRVGAVVVLAHALAGANLARIQRLGPQVRAQTLRYDALAHAYGFNYCGTETTPGE